MTAYRGFKVYYRPGVHPNPWLAVCDGERLTALTAHELRVTIDWFRDRERGTAASIALFPI